MAETEFASLLSRYKGYVDEALHLPTLEAAEGYLSSVLLKGNSATHRISSEGAQRSPLTAEERAALELSCRMYLEDLVLRANDAGIPIQKMGYEKLLDLVLWMSGERIVEQQLPYSMLGELVESQTIKSCEQIFDYIESRQSILTKEGWVEKGKLALLRVCNDLQRRLSKAKNNVFCGRILMFLAYVLPISERSGVNVKGQTNTANVTECDDSAADAGAADAKLEVDAEAGKDGHVDRAFHRSFWSLQSYFRNPSSLYAPDTWASMAQSLNTVLSAFDTYSSLTTDEPDQPTTSTSIPAPSPAPSSSAASKESPPGKEREETGGTAPGWPAHVPMDDLPSPETTCFSKFLTSIRLMNLQLNDAYFRRHILVQFLILFQTLRTNPSKLPSQQLKDNQKQQLAEMEQRVLDLLDRTPPRGRHFRTTVLEILNRENNWILWKKALCPAFERFAKDGDPKVVAASDPTSSPVPTRKRKSQGSGGPTADKFELPKRVHTPSAELNRLLNIATTNEAILQSVQDPKRLRVPKFDDLLKELREDEDPANDIEEDYKHKHVKSWMWKSLRVARRSNLVWLETYCNKGLAEALKPPPDPEKPKKVDVKPEAKAPLTNMPASPRTPSAAANASASAVVPTPNREALPEPAETEPEPEPEPASTSAEVSTPAPEDPDESMMPAVPSQSGQDDGPEDEDRPTGMDAEPSEPSEPPKAEPSSGVEASSRGDDAEAVEGGERDSEAGEVDRDRDRDVEMEQGEVPS